MRHAVDVDAWPQPRGAGPSRPARRAPRRRAHRSHRRRSGRDGADQPAARRRAERAGGDATRVRRSRCSPCAAPRPRRCAPTLGLDTVDDPTNDDRRFLRNRVRHEVLPLLDDIAERDVVPLLARTADRAPRRRRPARRARRRRSTPPTPGRSPPLSRRWPAGRCVAGSPATATHPTWRRSTGRSTSPGARRGVRARRRPPRANDSRQRLEIVGRRARATTPAAQ